MVVTLAMNLEERCSPHQRGSMDFSCALDGSHESVKRQGLAGLEVTALRITEGLQRLFSPSRSDTGPSLY